MKRKMMLLAITVLSLAASTAVWASGSTAEEPDVEPPEILSSGDYEYFLGEDGKSAIIADYKGDEDALEIPGEIEGLPVKEIGPQAFSYLEVTDLTIPDSVSVIGPRAFEYIGVSGSLNLPGGVTILDNAFSYAELPDVVTIPPAAAVERCAFSYCEGADQLNIGEGAVIRGRAFGYSDDITRIDCADGSAVEDDAFEYCDALEQVVLHGSVTIGAGAFPYCDSVSIIEEGASGTGTDRKPESGPKAPLAGGWEVAEDPAVTGDALEAFAIAMLNYNDPECKPVALLATQVVAGTNYCFLAKTRVNGAPCYKILYIWRNPQGEATVLEAHDLTFGLQEVTVD